MGIGVFEVILPTTPRHPRGHLVEDPALSAMDSRPDTSGMTISNYSVRKQKHLYYQNAPSLLVLISLSGVAVATSPKGTLPPASPWNPTESLLSENMNYHFEFTVNTCRYSSMKSGSLRHPWLSLTDTFQNSYSFTEMGVEVSGAGR